MFNSNSQRFLLLALSLPYLVFASPATTTTRRGSPSSPSSPSSPASPASPASSSAVPNPNIKALKAQFFRRYKSERVVIKYGPFNTLPSTTNNGMDTYEVLNAPSPCTDCLVTYIAANLEYPDGTTANTDTGMWLHHALLYSTTESDAVCPQYYPRRIFATGNERTPADISVNGTKESGIYLPPNATLLLQPELMNESPESRDVYLTLTYEYIPKKPSAFKAVIPVWLDITGVCGTSDFPAPPNAQAFSITSTNWTANVTGEIVFTAGHLHDGGTVLQILKRNESVCDSNATYAATPGYVSPMSMMPGMMPGDTSRDLIHISNMSSCSDVGMMREGQAWGVRAEYDFSKNTPMRMGTENGQGTLSPIMGIALLYVSQENEDDDDKVATATLVAS